MNITRCDKCGKEFRNTVTNITSKVEIKPPLSTPHRTHCIGPFDLCEECTEKLLHDFLEIQTED